MKTITILGSTGSVGRQVLEVIEKHPNDFKVVGLSAFLNEDLLREQIKKFNPAYCYSFKGDIEIQDSIFDYIDGNQNKTKYLSSLDELAAIDTDIVVLAVTGIVGIEPAITTLKRGGTLAIANKETIVCAGRHLKKVEKEFGGKILPLDTEHSAIFECLKGENKDEVSKLILTASGGALRDYPLEKLPFVTAEEALNHPVWSMGRKITIDCATLFNKGLEIIEAMNLFDMKLEDVQVLMHRESIIHSLVQFKDGSIKGLFSTPNLALSIETALFYPKLGSDTVKPLDLAKIGQLNFSSPDFDRYPCLKIVMDAASYGEGACISICVADEILVNEFLIGNISYNEISEKLEIVLNKFKDIKNVELNEIESISNEVTTFTNELIGK